MTARDASSALDSLLSDPPSWLPPVDHWEIASDDGAWSIQGQLAPGDDTPKAALRRAADADEVEVSDDGHFLNATFTWDGVAFRIWHLHPARMWMKRPDNCATCMTELGTTGFAWLGEHGADGQPPVDAICLPCRDAMHHRWLTAKCPADSADDHNWWAYAGGGWICAACRAVRTDPNDRATQTRAPNPERVAARIARNGPEEQQ